MIEPASLKEAKCLCSCSKTFPVFVCSFYQDEVDHATSVEELEKQIEKMAKVCLS